MTAEASAPAGDASSGPVEADAAAEHVHNLALVGTDLYLGTHEGLFKQPAGAPMSRVSAEPFDVMGLTRSGDSWFASGHPGEAMGGPADLGLITSADDGVTWSPVSLSGDVDFHRLSASGDTIMGVSAHDGAFMRSTDAGSTWTTLSAVPPFDLAVSPQDPLVVVGTTPDGPTLSRDGGETFTAIEGAPLIALVSCDGTDLYGIDPSGQVLVSSDEGRTWASRGTVAAEPVAATAQAVHSRSSLVARCTTPPTADSHSPHASQALPVTDDPGTLSSRPDQERASRESSANRCVSSDA